MDVNNQSMMIEGANPDMLWAQIMDNLATRAKSMDNERKRRIRKNQPFTWNDFDEINKIIHHDLDVIVSGNMNVEENKQYNDTNMNKKLIRLTEADLHRIVKESVNRILNEIGDTAKGQYMSSIVLKTIQNTEIQFFSVRGKL